MIIEMQREQCPDCGVRVGEPHQNGCDVERCPLCGRQFISCDCDEETTNSITDEQREKWDGFWPGIRECFALGLYCYWGGFGIGWIPCDERSEGKDKFGASLNEWAVLPNVTAFKAAVKDVLADRLPLVDKGHYLEGLPTHSIVRDFRERDIRGDR